MDFADVKTIMSGAGPAWMAIGNARGEDRAVEAAKAAINSPLLDVSIDGAKGVLLNVSGGTDLTLNEVQKAADLIESIVDPDANIIFGMSNDPRLEDEVPITIIATGFQSAENIIPNSDDLLSQLDIEVLDSEDELDIHPFIRRNKTFNKRGIFGL